MLIEFSVSNFRSIKTKQTFSMAAEKPHKEVRCVLDTGFKAAPSVLECAAIYGPNGSGKSNVILAVEFFQEFVITSSREREPGQPISVIPFLFSKDDKSQPSEFEIVFVHKEYLFQYGFILDKEMIHKEWLYATPQTSARQSAQTWLLRDRLKSKKEWVIRKELKGEKEVWKESTRDEALFLSTAVHLNSQDFGIPFEWIRKKLITMGGQYRLSPDYTESKVRSENEDKAKIVSFMKRFDVSFEDIHIDQNSKLFSKYTFIENQEYLLPFEEESEGTKLLFAFSGPILSILENGGIFIVDELERSLHPLAFQGIVDLFQDRHFNKNNAQLIFTSHNTTIMNMMDRDQIWLIDKSEMRASELVSVADFKGRPDEVVEKRYLTGRYAALPRIKDFI